VVKILEIRRTARFATAPNIEDYYIFLELKEKLIFSRSNVITFLKVAAIFSAVRKLIQFDVLIICW